MSFPKTYKSNIRIENHISFKNEDEILRRLYFLFRRKNVDILDYKNEKISFSTKQSLFHIKYFVKISCQNKKKIFYEIEIIYLIQVMILLIFLGIFMTSFSFTSFIFYAIIFSFLFFYLNVFIVSNFITNEIKKVLLILEKETFRNQKKWETQENICPACGEEINKYHFKCLECGIKLKNSQFINHTNLSNFKNWEIKYDYKNKDNKK